MKTVAIHIAVFTEDVCFQYLALSAPEKTEEKRQENHSSQPPDHFLSSIPGPRDSQLRHTVEELPSLFQRMRHRWTSEKAEYAFMSAVSSAVLFERYFWDYIDQSRLDHGEVAVQEHEERLQLLNPRAKTLLDWIVQFRMQESLEEQGEDPESLLDRIIAQMDGA